MYHQDSNCYIVLLLLFQPSNCVFPAYSVIFLEEDLLFVSQVCPQLTSSGQWQSGFRADTVDNGNISINIHLQFNTCI